MSAKQPNIGGVVRGEILFITDRRYWDASIGSEQRVAGLIRYLCRRELPIAVAYTGRLRRGDRRALRRFRAACRNLVVFDRRLGLRLALLSLLGYLRPRSDIRAGEELFDADAGALPGSPLERISPRRRAFIGRLIRERAPRVVVVEFTRLTGLVWPRPAVHGEEPEYWLDLHDLLHERAERTRGEGFRPAIDVNRETELRAISHFDVVIAIQAREAETVRQLLPEKTVLVVPYGVDIPTRPAQAARADGAVMRIGFLGGRDISNGAALDWFVENVWPALRAAQGSSVEFVVAGQICDRWTPPREHGIQICGAIDSVDEFWPKIDVAINPVRFGSGLKIKNVEALAFGCALLTTPVGAQGLEEASPDGLCIAERQQDWIDTLQAWQSDEAARRKVGACGRRFAIKRLSEKAAYSAMAERLEAALGKYGEGRR